MNDGGSAFADARLRDLDPRPSPLPASLVRAREGLARATPLFLSIPDSSLESEWAWIGEGEGDVRSGFYVAVQALERAAGQVRRFAAEPAGGSAAGPAAGSAPGPAPGPAPKPAAGSIGAATEARWELHGLLCSLEDESLDADPGGEEWTVRRTLAHTLASQRAYGWFTSWWMGRRDAPDYPLSIPDAVAEEMEAQLPEVERNADGSVADIRVRLDGLVDLASELWRDTSEEELAVRARWMGFPVTAGFRVGRWSTHIQEHTIQVEKTLLMLDRPPTEVQRMVRLLYRAFGRMESAVEGAGSSAEANHGAGSSAEAIDAGVGQVEVIAAGIAEAAGTS